MRSKTRLTRVANFGFPVISDRYRKSICSVPSSASTAAFPVQPAFCPPPRPLLWPEMSTEP